VGRIEVSAVLPAPVADVWALCKDIDRTADWFPAIRSVRPVTEQREGVGAEYEFTARNAGRIVTYRMRVTDWDEERLVRQEIVPGSGSGLWSELLQSMSVVWQYAPQDNGTSLRVTQEMKLKGPADVLTQPWLWWFDRRLYRRAFRRLAAVMAEGRN
jgi:carbon monoxide dehydrogenase subunit G